jgi:hypothetical protein
MAVDSFNMVNWAQTEGTGLLTQLMARKEYFANVLRIDTVNYKWSITRMTGGWLHTDGRGSYSSRPFGPITQEVPKHFTESYTLGFLPKPRYTNYYGYGSGTGTGGSSDWFNGKRWDYESKSYLTSEEWERRRKARADRWSSLYEEDEVGSGGGTGATIPPFDNSPNRKIEQKVEKGAVDAVIQHLNQKGVAAVGSLIDDGDAMDPLDTEVHVDYGPSDEDLVDSLELTAEEEEWLEEEYGYGYRITREGVVEPAAAAAPAPASCQVPAPTVLGPATPPAAQTVVRRLPISRDALAAMTSTETPKISPVTGKEVLEPKYDLARYQRWLFQKRNRRGA